MDGSPGHVFTVTGKRTVHSENIHGKNNGGTTNIKSYQGIDHGLIIIHSSIMGRSIMIDAGFLRVLHDYNAL